MTTIEIRAGVPWEAPRLTEIAYAAKRHWGYPEDWIALWSSELTVTPGYVRSTAVFVATAGGHAVGFTAVGTDGRGAEVDHLWVWPENMGQGIGTSLVRRAVAYCRSNGFRRLRVVSDPNAERFYVRLGARRTGSLPASPAPRRLPVLEFDLGARANRESCNMEPVDNMG